jgi:hypothetical protein
MTGGGGRLAAERLTSAGSTSRSAPVEGHAVNVSASEALRKNQGMLSLSVYRQLSELISQVHQLIESVNSEAASTEIDLRVQARSRPHRQPSMTCDR